MPTQRTLLSWAIAAAAAIAAMVVFLWDGWEAGETADVASMVGSDNVAVATDVRKWKAVPNVSFPA
jgi:hypothetical protein